MCTLGPSSASVETIEAMVKAGMNVARLNFSHGTYEEHAAYINSIREVAEELNKKVPIIQDLSGPRLQQKEGHNFDSSADSIITEKDLKDLEFGLEQSVDYVAMSYIGKAEDGDRVFTVTADSVVIFCVQFPVIGEEGFYGGKVDWF